MAKLYGVNWPEEKSRADIELTCYKYPEKIRALNGELRDSHFHFAAAIRELFTPEQVEWHRWLDEDISIWCDDDNLHSKGDGRFRQSFFTEWGPGACGKSNNLGLFALVDWWAGPKETCTMVCSTTREMLLKRIWESVTRHFNHLNGKGMPGKPSNFRTAIINNDEDDSDSDKAQEIKAGIFGIAVQQGTAEKSKSNIIGVHLPFVRLIIDEAQSPVTRSAFGARKNLSKGCTDFKFAAIGNPMHELDPLSEHSEPIDGWHTIDVTHKQWKTKYGMCYHRDGFLSPGILEPERLHFMINQAQIDADIDEKGSDDDPDIWTFVRGFPPPERVRRSILSPQWISKYRMKDAAEWYGPYEMAAGLDPAFTADGNDCIFTPARVGYITTGELVCEFLPQIRFTIKASAGDPVAYQIANQAIDACSDMNIPIDCLAVDETGTQTIGDVIEAQSGISPIRVSASEKPSEDRASDNSVKSCREEYRDKTTELWHAIRLYGRHNQIRGLPIEAARQFCERELEPGHPKKLQSKAKIKKQSGRSPDHGDSLSLVVEVLKKVYGMRPGSTQLQAVGQENPFSLDAAQKWDINPETQYTHQPEYYVEF